MQETNEVIVAKIKDGMDVSGNMLKLWQQNRGFIRMTARRYKDYEDVEDLEQQGYIGLSNAVEGYRKDENVPFINYAALWIRQSMLRYIDENGSLVRIPSARRQEQRRYKKLVREFEAYTGRPPSDLEACRCMGINLKELKNIQEADMKSRVDSLDRVIQRDDDAFTMGDLIPSGDDTEDTVLEKVYQEQLKDTVWKAVDALPDRERQVIYFRYQEGKTLKETGDCIGACLQQVSHIEYKALRYMERMSRKNGLIYFIPDGLYRHNGVAEFNRTWTSSTELAALKIYDKDGAR